MKLPFAAYPPLRDALVSEGWVSPNTYCNYFAEPENFPAVYLFMVVDKETYNQAFIAYAGMSVKLAQRLDGHEIAAELQALNLYCPVWFKPTPQTDLRAFEKVCIRRFVPPWNIIGKPRGVIVS